MTASLWRIAAETPMYPADDLSGNGALRSGGRWNSPGLNVVYCATSISLAVLESLRPRRFRGLPFNRFLVRIELPDRVWNARSTLCPLPGGWDAIPPGTASRHAGDQWLMAKPAALLEVPSVIVPEETIVLVNPAHVDAREIIATTTRRWIYDPRFFSRLAVS